MMFNPWRDAREGRVLVGCGWAAKLISAVAHFPVQVYPLYLLEYSRHASSSEQRGMTVPDFVIGYHGASQRVPPGQWGRMLDGLMDEIRLMEECQALNRELWTETVDLTGG